MNSFKNWRCVSFENVGIELETLNFRNEKIGRFHEILTPNLYIRVFPNGDVLYSIRWIFHHHNISSLSAQF